MRYIEIEIVCDNQDEAEAAINRLRSGAHFMGRKHGEWVLFITCPVDEILALAKELDREFN